MTLPVPDHGGTDHQVPAGATFSDLAAVLEQALHTEPGTGAGTGTVTSLVVATSGSSGTPKRVRLPGSALRASGTATATRLGGHGRWLLALPSHHVAGLQVLARSALAGTEPVCLDPGAPFRAPAFAEAVERMTAGPRPESAPLLLTSLVPTQLHRLLADPEGSSAAAELDAVLLGGAAADPGLLARAREAGVRVVTTYGMSETCGGCVYDGLPLDGVQVRLGEGDRVSLGGPVVAGGYVDAPALSSERFSEEAGTRWFLTDDRGRWEDTTDGPRLRLLGRVDDVITTGGHKVEPRDVEEALLALPDVAEALVVGVPHPEWGQVVGAVVVGATAAGALPDARELKALLAEHAPTLPPHAVPRLLAVADRLPLLGPGKPDRAAARQMLSSAAQ